jgi:acyl dehydratase
MIEAGDEVPQHAEPPIQRIQLVKYAGASGDFNRIHVEEGFAVAAGYKSVFAHGMLTMAFLGKLAARFAGGPHRVRRIACRFKAITWPGDVVTCHGLVTSVRDEDGARLAELKLWATTQEGAITCDGTATIEAR